MAARLGAVLLVLLVLSACKSAKEKCEDARRAAEAAWRADIAVLSEARKHAIDMQGQSQLELTQKIEPRMSDAAAKAATARYDRGTDAWQRAFIAAGNAACGSDPDCTRVKHAATVARDQQTDLDAKLRSANLALVSVRQSPDRAKGFADAIIADDDSVLLDAAKKRSIAVFTACQGVAE